MRNRQTRTIKQLVIILSSLILSTVAIANNAATTAYITNNSGNATPSKAQFQTGLIQVLRKISGNPAIDSVTSLAGDYQNPEKIVQAFTHQNAIGPSGKAENILAISFNVHAIYLILQNANQNIWPLAGRPSTLIIIHDKDNTTDPIISSDSDNKIKNQIIWRARILGIKILWPMLDLSDTQTIKYPLDDAAINSLKARYAVKNILSANIVGDNVSWSAWLGDNNSKWQTQTKTNWIKTGFRKFLGMLSDTYAASSSGSQSAQITINVSGIDELSDLQRATNCISKSPRIDNMQIKSSDMNSVTISAKVIDIDGFINKIKNTNQGSCKFKFEKFYYVADPNNTDSEDDSPNTIDLNLLADDKQ